MTNKTMTESCARDLLKDIHERAFQKIAKAIRADEHGPRNSARPYAGAPASKEDVAMACACAVSASVAECWRFLGVSIVADGGEP